MRNSLEASCQKVSVLLRQSRKFILSNVLSSRTPFRRLPWLGGQYLDLYLLYRKVTSAGGWVKVGRRKFPRFLPILDSHSSIFTFKEPLSCD